MSTLVPEVKITRTRKLSKHANELGLLAIIVVDRKSTL